MYIYIQDCRSESGNDKETSLIMTAKTKLNALYNKLPHFFCADKFSRRLKLFKMASGNIACSVAFIKNGVNGIFNNLGFFFKSKAVTQKHSSRKNCCKRICKIFSGNVRSRTVNRLLRRPKKLKPAFRLSL